MRPLILAALTLLCGCYDSATYTSPSSPEIPIRMAADLPEHRAECIAHGGRIGTREDWCSTRPPGDDSIHWGCADGDPPILVCMMPVHDM